MAGRSGSRSLGSRRGQGWDDDRWCRRRRGPERVVAGRAAGGVRGGGRGAVEARQATGGALASGARPTRGAPLAETAAALDRYPKWKEYFYQTPALDDLGRCTAGEPQWAATFAQLIILELAGPGGPAHPGPAHPRVPLAWRRSGALGPARRSDRRRLCWLARPDVPQGHRRRATPYAPKPGKRDTAVRQHPWFLMRGSSIRQRVAMLRYLGRGCTPPAPGSSK